jgi:hypothetical protein|tara:strand:- start:18912 stop:20042 length:1131 start_codon:yes stop_codon:yes gene_type:complete
MNLKESIKNLVHDKVVNEIDWDDDFQDVKKSCIPSDQLKLQLQGVLDRLSLPAQKRGELPLNRPIIGKSYIHQDEDGEIDVQAFIEEITVIPTKLISQNGKMEKTSQGDVWAVNTGIPALNGIVYDISGKEFFQVNTCPGAGTCAVVCYARKGSFVRFDHVSRQLTQRLNFMLNDPQSFESIIYLELKRLCVVKNSKGIKVLMRWNDAGDFFTKKYWDIAHNVTKRLLSEGHNFLSYAYTKMGDYAGDISKDILVNFSRDANKREKDKVDINNVKASTIETKDVFKDLFVKGKGAHFQKDDQGKPMFVEPQAEARQELKNRLAKKHNLPVDSILYQEELPQEEQEKNQFNLIVLPSGESDLGAHREDVQVSFLLIH